MPDIQKLHQQVLYPVVRVRAQEVGGSGTVIFSGRNKKEEVETFVLTNHHVVEKNIEVKSVWDSNIGKERKKDTRATAYVEFFHYNDVSHCIGTNAIEADIMAYDKEQDIALLRLRDKENLAKHVAAMLPVDRVQEVKIFDQTYACGATLGHAPLATAGHINFLDDEIDNFKYWASTSQMCYGNSGGAVFRENTDGQWEYIGIPSRVAVIGWFTPVTHMGYLIPIARIVHFLEEAGYQFLYDSSFTSEQCEALRKEKAERERRLLELKEGPVESNR